LTIRARDDGSLQSPVVDVAVDAEQQWGGVAPACWQALVWVGMR